MSVLAAERMRDRLTLPFRPGADRLELRFAPGATPASATLAQYDFAEHAAASSHRPQPRYVATARRDVAAATRLIFAYQSGAMAPVAGTATLDVPAGTMAGASFALGLGSAEGPGARLMSVTVDPPDPGGSIAAAWTITALLGNAAKLLWAAAGEEDVLRAQLARVARERRLLEATGATLDLIGFDLGVRRFPPLPYTLDPPGPPGVQAGALAAGGSLPAGTHHYVVTAVTGSGESVASAPAAAAAVAAGGRVAVQWRPVLGARAYCLYRGAAAGAERFLFQVSGDATETVDDGSVAASPAAPPRGAVALYHLDDRPPAGAAEVAQVENRMELYGGRAHPGANVAAGGAPPARSGVAGRFGTGFDFRAAGAQITVADDPDFALSAVDSFTAETFARVDDDAGEGVILAKQGDPAAPTSGWSLMVGTFGRGIARNIRFLVADAASSVPVFLDAPLEPGRFHHLAGVIDRRAGQARLHVDGRVAGVKPLGALGAPANTEPVRFGGFKGDLDEVRLSRAAHRTFKPVLGEPDESYRRRLMLFARWLLPTPERLRAALNLVAGEVGGDPEPFVVEDLEAGIVTADRPLTIRPVTLVPGAHIAADGDRSRGESAAAGTAADEPGFEPRLLTDIAGARMQLGVARALERLQALAPGLVHVQAGYAPEAPGLRAVGRALELSPGAPLTTARLAALAHRAGFDWVLHDAATGTVHAAMGASTPVGIDVVAGATTTATGFDLLVGEEVVLRARPAVAAPAELSWSLIACGSGRGELRPGAAPAEARLTATLPGRLSVRLELRLGAKVFSTVSMLRIGPDVLLDGQAIGTTGRLDVPESVAGRPGDQLFHPAYLTMCDDARVDDRGEPLARRTHPALRERVERLLDLLDDQAPGGALQVSRDLASADDLESVGRSVTLVHTVASTGLLGALAHAAGFSYVRREGGKVLALQAAGPLAAIVPSAATADEGTVLALRVEPRARPAAIALSGATVVVANSGTDTASRIDVNAGRIVETHKVGWEPVGVAVGAGAKVAYSADRRSGTVTAVELGGAVADRLDVGGAPVALVRHPANPALLVALDGNELVEVDTSTLPLSVSSRIALGDRPTALAISPNGSTTWVALAGGSLEVHGAAPATVPLPGPPGGIAATNARAYVTLPSLGQVALVEATPPHNVKFVAVGTAPAAVAAGASVVCVADGAEARVHVLTPAGTLQRTVAVGRIPLALAMSGDRLCVAVRAPDGDEGSVDGVRAISIGSLETTAMVPLGSGLGERITWTLRPLAAAQAGISAVAAAATKLTAVAAGPVLVRAHLLRPDLGGSRGSPPFTFEVRLKDALQADPSVVIRKDQYDLVMNALSAFHPVGVEVLTRAIREKVVELREGLLDVFPDYTFPQFRARGPRPGARRPKE